VRAPALLLAALLALTGCSGSATDSGPSHVPETQTADPSVLPAGRDDLALAPRTYYSPRDFVPPLAVTVPAGWHSTHRGDDAFDLSRPDPARGGPLVTVVFVTPPDDTAATALAAARAGVEGGTTTPVTGTLAGGRATGFDLVGGTGTLLTSPAGTISLDVAPRQRVRVLGTDIDDVPLLVAVVVHDGARWAQVLPHAQQVLDRVGRG
jgi:hypothetical protein